MISLKTFHAGVVQASTENSSPGYIKRSGGRGRHQRIGASMVVTLGENPTKTGMEIQKRKKSHQAACRIKEFSVQCVGGQKKSPILTRSGKENGQANGEK